MEGGKRRLTDEDQADGFLGDNTQPAEKKVKMPSCAFADCTGAWNTLLEWPCPRRHLVCQSCLKREISRASTWENKQDGSIGLPLGVVCRISCPGGCSDCELEFDKIGESAKLKPIHHEVHRVTHPRRSVSRQTCFFWSVGFLVARGQVPGVPDVQPALQRRAGPQRPHP
jgi:hypothetical protein